VVRQLRHFNQTFGNRGLGRTFFQDFLREEIAMLVLSRKVGEQIRIGNDIVVTVNRIDGNRVSIGIEAPTDVRIVRQELRQFDDVAAPVYGRNRLADRLPALSR
jgi:carbon storage regulator